MSKNQDCFYTKTIKLDQIKCSFQRFRPNGQDLTLRKVVVQVNHCLSLYDVLLLNFSVNIRIIIRSDSCLVTLCISILDSGARNYYSQKDVLC